MKHPPAGPAGSSTNGITFFEESGKLCHIFRISECSRHLETYFLCLYGLKEILEAEILILTEGKVILEYRPDTNESKEEEDVWIQVQFIAFMRMEKNSIFMIRASKGISLSVA